MRSLKEGDYVLILDPYKNDPDPDHYPGVTEKMKNFAGGVYSISEVLPDFHYRFRGPAYTWASRWLLPLNPLSEDLERTLEHTAQALEKNPKLLERLKEIIT